MEIVEVELTHENATHVLQCAHQIGSMRKEYGMRCHIIKNCGDKVRVLVWGERNWKGYDHVCRRRTVEAWRVTPRVCEG